jgi:CRISPR-associated endonuclease/helicase Cas3
MATAGVEKPDESVWGKSRGLDPALPPYPLVRHLLDAAAMALHLWDVYLSDNQRRSIAEGLGLAEEPGRARAVVGLCAGLHDIGKLSGFQFCAQHGREHLGAPLREDRGRMGSERLGHDVAGMRVAGQVLAVLGFESAGCGVSSVLSSLDGVTLGHRCRSGVRGSLELWHEHAQAVPERSHR